MKPAYLQDRGVHWLGRFLHPPSRRERLTLVLLAYLDASNEATGDPIAVVAGCVADENQWAAFENVWTPFLKEFELKRFHSSHFWARKEPPYSRWSDAKWEKAKGDVCRILGSLRIIGVGAVVTLKAFNEWRASSDQFYHHDPYYFCLQYTLGILIRRISQHPADEGITIYIDQDKGREALGREIAKWHQSRLRQLLHNDGHGVNPNRQVDTHYGSAIDFKPLQIADIISHGTYQWARDYLTAGKIEEPFFVNCLRKSSYLTTQMFFDVPQIETIWRERHSEKGAL